MYIYIYREREREREREGERESQGVTQRDNPCVFSCLLNVLLL